MKKKVRGSRKDPRSVVPLGERIAQLRGKMSQLDLARRAGIDEDTVRRAEHGEQVRRYSLFLIAQALGVYFSELVQSPDRPAGEGPGAPELPSLSELAHRLPSRRSEHALSRAEIEQLALRCGLLAATAVNPHLVFRDGDISYWAEQADRREWLIALEFLSRRIVLDWAERACRIFATQGDLSHAAAAVLSRLLPQAERFWREV